MPFKPHPLLDFESGIDRSKEPWLSPDKAPHELINARLHNGRMIKRKGYTEFAQLGVGVEDEVFGDGSPSDTTFLSNTPLKPSANVSDESDTYHIELSDGSLTAYGWTDDSWPALTLYLQRITEVLVAPGTARVSGGLTSAANIAQTPVTFTDQSATPQVITIQYISGSQFSSNAPVQGVTDDSDADPAGTNTWTPAVSTSNSAAYDVTFTSTAVGNVTIAYDKYIGYARNNDGGSYASYSGSWSDPVNVSYEYLTEDPVMGIFDFFTLDGGEYLVFCDTKRMWVYNATTGNPISVVQGFPYTFPFALGPGVVWSGTDSDFFHFCPFENILVINNGVDSPKKFTGSTSVLTDMGTDFDADGTNNIEAAQFCFQHKNRIVYLGPTEDGEHYANRARWTPVNDVEYAAATGAEASYYTDAATSDRLVAAAIIGDRLIGMFGRTMWVLEYSGEDAYSAFRWVQLPAIEGCGARMGFVNLGHSVLFRGKDRIRITDSSGVMVADTPIPDEVLTWNVNAEEYSYGVHVASEHEAFLSYTDFDKSYPEHVLAAQLDADMRVKGYSVHELAFHCFGKYRKGSVPTWDEAVAGLTVDEIEWTLDSLAASPEVPIVLAGSRDGIIYEYADGYTDDGTAVTLKSKWGRINPYPFNNCHLGYVLLVADAVTGGTARVLCFADYSTTAYKTLTFDLTPAGENSKVVRVARVNRIATFHTLQLEVESSGPFSLDTATLYCRPAGPMREI